jgi:hypothetical protein
VPDGLGALGLVELRARVLEPDVPLGPQSVMAVRGLVLALPLASLPVVPVLFWLVVELARPAVPGAFAVGLPASHSMLRSMVSRAPPVALGLVLACATAVPNIEATTDAAMKIVRRMRFPPFPQARVALRPLSRENTLSWRRFLSRDSGEVRAVIAATARSGKRRATRCPSITLISIFAARDPLGPGLRRARRSPCSRNSNTYELLSSATRKIS